MFQSLYGIILREPICSQFIELNICLHSSYPIDLYVTFALTVSRLANTYLNCKTQ